MQGLRGMGDPVRITWAYGQAIPYLLSSRIKRELIIRGLSKFIDKLRSGDNQMPLGEFWDLERTAFVLSNMVDRSVSGVPEQSIQHLPSNKPPVPGYGSYSSV
ncbi:hypothetical protein PHLCEN_2v73 [Hermanssonia centrifuga]|uniref:Uncharacterized protein n=1 Tax=Hermanssonia centrifuga TaxID=98765 RepID=A0A2R6S763_9APHY|nr:hypothetical protein PHLCEN_2v73 [Hermanssonia centrifuga]